jgi:hypothetical protein
LFVSRDRGAEKGDEEENNVQDNDIGGEKDCAENKDICAAKATRCDERNAAGVADSE